ncbi:MAG: penicillin-binding protein 2 [Chlamydiales bacterium]
MKENRRIVMLALSMFVLFALLIAQYFKIQILEGEKWTKEALAQHEFIVTVPFKRGAFYSNVSVKQGHPQNPQPLVFDVTKFHLYIDPLSIPKEHQNEIAERLIEMTQIDPQKRKEFELNSRSRRLASWLDMSSKEEILSWWRSFAKQKKISPNAIYFVTDYQRCYPFGKLLGQSLHTIQERKDETTYEAIPTGGLESYFNDYLKGKLGKRKLMRSPLNHLEIDKVIEAPQDGADVYLTIDHNIQAIVEEELEKGVQAAKAKGGWAVMMNPHNGEIMALAQYPFFNPTEYRDFFNDPEKIEITKTKAITDAYEFGSILKPITMAICLKANADLVKQGKEKLFDPEEKVDTTRTIFPGRKGRPLRDLVPCRSMNMYMAFQKSSNIYMAQIVERVVQALGNSWYRKELVETFGFGQKTGIELPSEAIGQIPTPGKLHPSGAPEWSLSTPFSLAMGYNMLATSLQILRAYAVFANGGYLVLPTLVRKIVKNDEDKVLVDHTNPERVNHFPKVLDEEIACEVLKGTKFSTKPGGSGRLAAVNGYTEAGKTSTAEKSEKGVYSKTKHVSSFIGMSPANLEPTVPTQFVLIVTLDEAAAILLEGGIKNHLGGRCAAPVFQKIAKRTLEYLGVPPDDPHGYPVGDPRWDPEKADWMKEVRELKFLYEKWNKP